jgi:hypothetical protein
VTPTHGSSIPRLAKPLRLGRFIALAIGRQDRGQGACTANRANPVRTFE